MKVVVRGLHNQTMNIYFRKTLKWFQNLKNPQSQKKVSSLFPQKNAQKLSGQFNFKANLSKGFECIKKNIAGKKLQLTSFGIQKKNSCQNKNETKIFETAKFRFRKLS